MPRYFAASPAPVTGRFRKIRRSEISACRFNTNMVLLQVSPE